jgi:hypothetical protein
MRKAVFGGLLAVAPFMLAPEVMAQPCPQGTVELPRGRGATISINRTAPEASLVTIEWLRDGSGYFVKDAENLATEQKAVDYKISNANAFAPRANSVLEVRVTGVLKDGSKCMGEATVRRMGDRAEVSFAPAKGGAPNTVVTVKYESAPPKQ